MIWSNQMCQIRTETQTSFTLPDAMTVVKTENTFTLSSQSRDICCQAFADGDITM